MKERQRWAFILDKDEFVRLSLKKILKKYGFEVEEIESLSQIEQRKKDIAEGMVLADMDVEGLEQSLLFFKRWGPRFVLMSPLVTEDFEVRVKDLKIERIIKKPVDPRMLREIIREMPFPGKAKIPLPVKKRGVPIRKKGGEGG